MAALLSKFWFLYKRYIQVSASVPEAKGPLSVFVPPGKISHWGLSKQTIHHRIMKRSLLINTTLNKRVWTPRFSFTVLSTFLYFSVYSEMIINLQMIKTIYLILFNNMSLPYSFPIWESFTLHNLKTQALERIEINFKDRSRRSTIG